MRAVLIAFLILIVVAVVGGAFYNRARLESDPPQVKLWAPGNTLEAVEREYRELLDGVAAETGCDIALDLKLVRGAYEIELDDPLLLALQESYCEVTGEPLEPVGMKVVADAAIFHAAGIPCVYQGPVGSGAHADVEYMTVGELVRATEVYLALLGRVLS